MGAAAITSGGPAPTRSAGWIATSRASLLRHLAQTPDARVMSVDATVVFADISGFTALSERLARLGREGAEELTHIIGGSLSTLLAVAYENGGSLLKLGGDALLLLFEHDGHAERACRAAVGMRSTLGEIGRLRTDAGTVTLRISQGVHSGTFHLFLVGGSHREQMLVGADASTVVRMEKAADAARCSSARRRPRASPLPASATRRAPGCCSPPRPTTSRSSSPCTPRRRSRPSRSACRRWSAHTSSRATIRPSTGTSRSRSCSSPRPTS